MNKSETLMKRAYAAAATVANDALMSIRTVTAFGGQAVECDKYEKHLLVAQAGGERKGLAIGITIVRSRVAVAASFRLSLVGLVRLVACVRAADVSAELHGGHNVCDVRRGPVVRRVADQQIQ